MPIGLFERAFPIILYREGISLQQAGLVRLVLLPWAFKFLWAPWIDRIGNDRFGFRKSWIVPLQLAAVVLAALLSFADLQALTQNAGGNLQWLLAGVLALNLLCATQDVATDGLAYKLLRYAERGPGNGIQAAGYQVGLILGGGLMLLLFDYLRWPGIMWVLAGLLCLPLLLVLPFKEPAQAAKPADAGSAWQAVTDFFKQPGMGKWAAIVCVCLLGNIWAFSVYRLFLVDAGLQNKDIFLMLDVVGVLLGAAGALAGGALLRKRARRTVFMGAMILVIACLLLYIVPAAGFKPLWMLYAAGLCNKLAGGVVGAALFTIMMDHCRPAHAGSDFTLQQCLFNLATITAAFSGMLAARVGFVAFFSICACMAVAALALVYVGLPTEEKPIGVTT